MIDSQHTALLKNSQTKTITLCFPEQITTGKIYHLKQHFPQPVAA